MGVDGSILRLGRGRERCRTVGGVRWLELWTYVE